MGKSPLWRRRRVRITAVVIALVLLAPVAAGTALRLEDTGTPDARARTRGHDAVWLGHAWVDGRRTDADVAALAGRIRGTGIRDLYVHAGPLDGDGSLDPAKSPQAAWAVRALRTAIPGVRVQAWLGQQVGRAKGDLDLDDASTRTRVVTSARQVLDKGFDGVHFDFEPVPDGDRGLLALLDATAAMAHRRARVVSIASHHVEPVAGLTSAGNAIVGHNKWWTPGYLRQVARRVDQIAIMSYDTALPLRSLYGGYVRRQTDLALRNVPSATGLLMGLPAYHTDDWGHHASAETVGAAVRGVRLALGGNPRQDFGVALYVDFAATDADWSAYRRDWVTP
ncbi:glycosyl hydrolase family 18 protein [Actinomadura sp. DC4]|uniref:glycosyl hydrolase family 18 protein n=1 Tax=Actinomadura sp. DC4 TaxID=3055069 RepID=UPI0025AF2FC8|nr:glycosyl hydrolase family 18 protein [Actinomadura sp. DC4]MDN3354221.1 glycosyl hydrolase family 18 protein [Actinomadura sp. DC4]